jgi:cell division protein FtsB
MDNESYRRGQALGFTVAELFTLLLFLVLFILAAAEQHAVDKLRQLQKKLDAAKQNGTALAEKNRALRKYFGVPDNFGDNFADLVPRKEGLSDGQNEQALEEKGKAADNIHDILNGAPSAGNIGHGSEYDPKALAGQVKSCVDENQTLKGENQTLEKESQTLKGQLANLEKRYGGGGTVFPSCWVTPSGGTEFVFNVDLLSGSEGGRLIIHANAVTGHDQEKVALFKDLRLEEPLIASEFLAETRAFYDFGLKHQPQCRFFVHVNDQTGPQDKSTFKELLLTVEKNFYKALSKID